MIYRRKFIFIIIALVVLAFLYLLTKYSLSGSIINVFNRANLVDTSPVTISKDEIVRGSTKNKQIVFTFDGGSGVNSLEKILDTLKKNKIKSSFFLTGKFVENNPTLSKRIVAEGHEVYNHTYSHKDLTGLSETEIRNELKRTESVFKNILGKTSKPYFRAPYGARNSKVIDIAYSEGYTSAYWTVDALDWKETIGETEDSVKNRIFSKLSPGTIYLIHIGDDISGNILDDVIKNIKKEGYTIVPISKINK